jgi:2'-5' RNA ligase
MIQPLILTLRLDVETQAFFNARRKRYFPPGRNYLDAHLTLFHQLPNNPVTIGYLANLHYEPFTLQTNSLMNLGAGVAYRIDSPELKSLHKLISNHFQDVLIPQDRQGFRPHIVVMNKSTPAMARALMAELTTTFQPFNFQATGLNLWTYLDGPWQHLRSFTFSGLLA